MNTFSLSRGAAILAAVGSLLSPTASQNPIDAGTVDTAQMSAGGQDHAPIHTGSRDNGIEYGVWAAGDRYKVSFHGDMTFIPYLGFDYPKTQSVSWHTQSVRLGGTELLTGQAPKREHTEFRYEYRHGAVTEAYDVRVDGLEQTFVIHQRPQGSGDLVVRGALSSTLSTPRFDAAHGALTFADDHGDAIVGYSEGYVLDADGRKGPVLTSHRNGVIELTVPAAWLQNATWPVTIDPVLSNTVAGGGFPHRSVDVVRDDSGNDVMVCFSKGASASDQDAYAYIMSDTFANRTLVFSDVTASWSTETPSCATTGAPRKYCVVFSREFTNSTAIRCHLHDSNDLTFSTSVIFVTTNTTNRHDSRPDVGGAEPGSRFQPTGQNFMIVWQRDVGSATTNGSTIYGRRLRASGTFGLEFAIAINSLFLNDHEDPAITQQSQRTGSVVGTTTWMVVYQKYGVLGPTWGIEGKLVNDSTTTAESGYTLRTNSNHRLNPKVAGRSGRYLVAYTDSPYSLIGFKTASELGHSLKTQRVDWAPGGSPTAGTENTLFGPYNAGRRMILGGVAYDSDTDSHWAVTSGSSSANGGTGRTIINRLGFNGRTLDSQTLQSRPNSSEQGDPGGVTFNDDRDEFIASWTMNAAGIGRAWTARYTYPSAPAPTTSGASCSTATLAWSGSQQIGSEFSRVTMTGAVPSQFAWLLAGTSPTNINLAPQGMPGCALLVPSTGAGHIGMWTVLSDTNGNARVDLPLSESLNGINVYFQWFHVQPGTNALDLVSTERLRVPLVK